MGYASFLNIISATTILQFFVNAHVCRIVEHSSHQNHKTEVHFTDILLENSATTAIMLLCIVVVFNDDDDDGGGGGTKRAKKKQQ